ncbi:MAG: Sporulation sigma-E factor-processing peptidase [Syntrophomonadaceae bacterium]|nr:Sporulation sigma-E factor-processing peptidase [Bacillota bacterium]
MFVEDLLVLNLMLNTFLLFLAARLVGKTVKKRRLLAGGGLAALYSLVVYLPEYSWLTSWTAKSAVSLLVTVFVFRPVCLAELLRLCGAFFLAAFFLAGTVFALHFYGGAYTYIRGGAFHIAPLQPEVLFAGALIALLLVLAVWLFGERRRGMKRLCYRLILHDEGKEVEFPALLDTGNNLRDPLSGKPLCIATYSVARGLLPDILYRAFETGRDPVSTLSALEGRASCRFAVVPYRSLESGGLLVTFRPDAVYLLEGGKRRLLAGAVIALTSRKFFLDDSLAALLHPDALV